VRLTFQTLVAMRFAIATAGLLLAGCEASSDEAALENNEIQKIKSKEAVMNGKSSFYDRSQSINQRRTTQSQLGRRFALTKKNRASKLSSMKLQEKKSLAKPKRVDHTSPDLGILEGRYLENNGRNLRIVDSVIPRAAKESIMEKDSMRESSEKQSNAAEFLSTSSQNNADDENDVVPNEYSSFMLGSEKSICDYPNCECEDFDIESVSGAIECENYVNPDDSDYCESTINYCGEPVEICYRETMSLEAIDSETYSYTSCYTNSKPYQQHVCITFDHTAEQEDSYEVDMNTTEAPDPNEHDSFSFTNPSSNSCSVQFNNMECRSCSTEIRTLKQYSVNEETGESEIIAIAKDRCFNIDCSNVGGESAVVNTCDGRLFPSTLRENVLFGDDCTRCQPCGLGQRLQNPDAEGYFPVIGEYMCSGMELAAKAGFFDRDLCSEIQSKTDDYCGCEPIFYDAALTPTPRTGEASRSEGTRGSTSGSYYAPVLLPGDTIGDKACDVCGSQTAIVANPDAIVTLPNGVPTSCSALQGAGRLGMFTSEYCRSHVMPLVFRTCGGCFRTTEEHPVDPIPIIAASHVEAHPTMEDNVFNDAEDNAFDQRQDNAFNQMEESAFKQGQDNVFNQTENMTISLPAEDNVTTPPSATHATTTTTTTTHEGFVSCRVCPEGSGLVRPDNLVARFELLISCRDLADELETTGSTFTESYCRDEVRTIVDNDCGGCGVVVVVNAHGGGGGLMSSRIDAEGDRKPGPAGRSRQHSEIPEEIDVVSNAPGDGDGDADRPVPNAAAVDSTTETSSSGIFAKPIDAWMCATAVAAIPFCFLVAIS